MNSGRFKLATSNANIFTDSYTNDLILQGESSLQKILVGVGTDVRSTIVINSNSVGIGTNIPLNTLDVRGNARFSQDQYIYGNIGIGTTNTLGNKLYVIGDIRNTGLFRTSNIYIEGDLTVMGTQTIVNTDVAITDQFTVSNIGTDTAVKIYQSGEQNMLEVYDDNKIAFVVANNSKIGIGTLTPSDTFQVWGNSIMTGNITVNCNLNIDKIANITGTVNCLSNIVITKTANISGSVNCYSNLDITGVVNCLSNINIDGKFFCDTVNNIILNYDVPDIIVNSYSSNTRYIELLIKKPSQDNDGFGNLIPHVDKLYVTYSNSKLGQTINITSNNIENIEILRIHTGETLYNQNWNSYSNIMDIYGLITASNYKLTLYYENYRGKSINNYIINSITLPVIGVPSLVQNLNTNIINSSNLNISFTTPLYTDSINNNNLSILKNYYLNYSAINSIKYDGIVHSNNYTLTTSNLLIENYKDIFYTGTLYKIDVCSRNENLNKYSSNITTYFYTGFDSNDFHTGSNLNDMILNNQNTTSYYPNNTYYAVDCGSNGPVSYFTTSSNIKLMSTTNSFYKYTVDSNIRLFYNPNPRNSNVGTITSKLDIVSKFGSNTLETLNLNIKQFNDNTQNIVTNNKYLGLRLTSLNTTSSYDLGNFFERSGLEITMNYNSKSSNNSYNKYNLNTKISLSNFSSWEIKNTSNLQFNTTKISNIQEGDITFEYYYNNLSNNCLLNSFSYTLSNYNTKYISGICNSSNYNLNYNITLSNVGNYWVVNPMLKITDINSISSFNKEITTSNNYYYQYQPIYSYLFYDMSTNNRTLTGNLPIYSSNTPYSNIENYSLDFNNVSQKTVVINNINDGIYGNWNRNYTINFWLYLCEYPSQTSILFLNSPNGNPTYSNGSISITTTGKIEYNCWLGNINTSITSLGLNTWNYITLIWTTTNNSTFIYINGILDSTKTNISVNYWGLGSFMINNNLPSNKFLMNDFRYSFNIKSTSIPTSPLTIDSDTFLLLKYDKLTTNPYTNYNYTSGLNNNILINLDKATLSNGLSTFSNNLIFKETDNFVVNSNVLYSNLDYNITGYSILNSNTSNVSIGLFQNDLNSLNHPHILINSSSNIYGKRVFADCLNITNYPAISIMDDYNNSSNITLTNYAKEAVLFNGYYYGENTSNTWKKNWSTLNTNSFDYSSVSITNTRWNLVKFTNINGSTTNLELTINDNSHNDKLIYIKYQSDELNYESPWFNGLSDYNGKSLYVNRVVDDDGIKDISKIDTQYLKYIKCIPLEDLTIYVFIGIPITNSESKYSTLSIMSI
jgi:hypothetical protein